MWWSPKLPLCTMWCKVGLWASFPVAPTSVKALFDMYMGSLSYSKPHFVYSDATRQFSSDPKQECHIITLIDSDNPHCAARHKVAQAASKLPDDDSKKTRLAPNRAKQQNWPPAKYLIDNWATLSTVLPFSPTINYCQIRSSNSNILTYECIYSPRIEASQFMYNSINVQKWTIFSCHSTRIVQCLRHIAKDYMNHSLACLRNFSHCIRLWAK